MKLEVKNKNNLLLIFTALLMMLVFLLMIVVTWKGNFLFSNNDHQLETSRGAGIVEIEDGGVIMYDPEQTTEEQVKKYDESLKKEQHRSSD